jgi:ubiquinone/menaquinone biosynthesis C-methylase UbiE
MTWLFGRRRGAVAGTGADTGTNSRGRQGAQGSHGAQGAAGDYVLGESEAEISRLNFQHYMFRFAFGADYSSPLGEPAPRAILDVASGTGRWAREMARRFPAANVVGFDINRELLEASLAEGLEVVPENSIFVLGDALRRFPFPDSVFDVAMARACSSFIPAALWPQVVGEMIRVTRPGGWVEVRDFGLAQSSNAAVNELTVKFALLAQGRGLHPGAGPFLKQYLAAARLRDVRVSTKLVRSGGKHGTRAGQLGLIDYLALLERFTPFVERAGLDSAAHWQTLLSRARAETRASPDAQYVAVELTAAYGRR